MLLSAAADPPARCQEVIDQDENYLRCMQAFESLFSDLTGDTNAINRMFCSTEGKAAVGCVIENYSKCPHLFRGANGTNEENNIVDEVISLIHVSGRVESYCQVFEEGCKSTFERCTSPLNLRLGNGDIFKKRLPTRISDTYMLNSTEYERGPMLYSIVPAQVEILCGPMEEIMTCAFNASDKCPHMVKTIEEILALQIERQREKWWPNFPAYMEAEKYIKAKCPSLPGDFGSKRSCLETSALQPGFAECFANNTNDKKTVCGEYSIGKKCVINHVQPDCDKDYATVLYEASYLFSENIPSHCQQTSVSGVSRTQASAYLTILMIFKILSVHFI